MKKRVWETLWKAMECLENTEPVDDEAEAAREQDDMEETYKWLLGHRPLCGRE